LEGLRRRPGKQGDTPVDSSEDKAFEEILLDVQRTPHLSEGQDTSLINILVTYCSRQSKEEGSLQGHYVQGMHMLAACPLWAGLSEARALSIFEFVLRSLCVGYYVDATFAPFQRDVRVADALIAERLPQLAAALQTSGISTMTLTFDSLLCLFTRHMPLKSVLRLWDVLLLEGDAAVFAVLLALLERLMSDGSSVGAGDSFPFAERLRDFSAHTDVEELISRAKAHQDWPGSISLRQRLQQLRREALAAPDSDMAPPLAVASGGSIDGVARALRTNSRGELAAGAGWWEQALFRARAFLVDDDDSDTQRMPPPLPHHGKSLGSAAADGPPLSPLSKARCSLADVSAHVVDLGDRGATVNSELVRTGMSDLSRAKEAFATLPVEFTMTLSQEYKAGDMVTIIGPHGRMQVQPPPGAEPGANVRYRLGPRPDFEIRVPAGSGPGKEVKFVRKDGVSVAATVPDGMRPGDVFGVLPPAVMVLVPEGAEPGDPVVFRALGGPPAYCRAYIPPGMRPGKYFAARLPPPPEQQKHSGGWLADLLGAL